MTTDPAREEWIERLAAATRAEWDSQTYPAYAFLSGPLSDQQKRGLSKLAARIAADFAERLALAHERGLYQAWVLSMGEIPVPPLPWAEAMKGGGE
jgi:hypothetical protein